MFNSIFGLSGSALAHNHNYATVSGQSGLANQASNSQTSQWHAQQMMAYSQALMRNQHRWMVNGVSMTFAEFLDTICPEPDDPMRTFLTLKYAGTR